MSVKRFGLDPDDKFGLSEDDVIAIQSKDFGLESMIKISRLIQAIQTWSGNNSNNKGNESQWFLEQGLPCEILRTSGGGWQKGKFRFRLEFIPDKPEVFLKISPPEEEKPQSPLDDLRSHLDV
ncbi:KGK [Nostoc flagelliforme CCNUN1]|uniref:KGK n=1 Tax=Nostoc flagelliforme CCNUN1 TaxID=2038116 RepID=A0A2K8T2Q9_9NOSO|nr:KGK domain-containing protein [Nostoc flagelliforme]AUB41305.1 KGK [Nostoc flagelliforme CCNUN1]